MFKKPCPVDLRQRVLHALTIGALHDIPDRTTNEIRSFMADKIVGLYNTEISKIDALNKICEWFGIDIP